MVERTDDHPGTGSATYCSAVSLRQASRTLVLAQRSYANRVTTSSCMRNSSGRAIEIMVMFFGGTRTWSQPARRTSTRTGGGILAARRAEEKDFASTALERPTLAPRCLNWISNLQLSS